MKTFTKNEMAVFNEIASISFDGSVATIKDLTTAHLTGQQAGGVLASLITKGMVFAERSPVTGDDDIIYWPNHPEYGAVFLTDYLSDDEFKAFLITEEQVHG